MKRLFDAGLRQYMVKTVSCEGSAVWSDGLKCVLPSVKLLGQTKQQSYSGKNLFDMARGTCSGNAAYECLEGSIRVTGMSAAGSPPMWNYRRHSWVKPSQSWVIGRLPETIWVHFGSNG